MARLRAGFLATLITLRLMLHAIVSAAPLNTTDITTAKSDSCVWEFSPTICGQGISYQQLIYPRKRTCIPLATPMKNVWTNECSSWFGACTFWIQPDCTGQWSVRVDDPSNSHLGTCFSNPYYISAVSCEQA